MFAAFVAILRLYVAVYGGKKGEVEGCKIEGRGTEWGGITREKKGENSGELTNQSKAPGETGTEVTKKREKKKRATRGARSVACGESVEAGSRGLRRKKKTGTSLRRNKKREAQKPEGQKSHGSVFLYMRSRTGAERARARKKETSSAHRVPIHPHATAHTPTVAPIGPPSPLYWYTWVHPSQLALTSSSQAKRPPESTLQRRTMTPFCGKKLPDTSVPKRGSQRACHFPGPRLKLPRSFSQSSAPQDP